MVEATQAAQSANRQKPERILVVSDSTIASLPIISAFAKAGYEVAAASSYNAAKRALALTQPGADEADKPFGAILISKGIPGFNDAVALDGDDKLQWFEKNNRGTEALLADLNEWNEARLGKRPFVIGIESNQGEFGKLQPACMRPNAIINRLLSPATEFVKAAKEKLPSPNLG